MILDVLNDGSRDEIAHAHMPLTKETDLGATDVVLNGLRDDEDVMFPGLKAGQGVFDVGANSLDNESSISTEDMVEVLGAPHAWLRHGLDQVGSGE